MTNQPTTPDAEHSIYSPSSARRWVNCPGSLVYAARLPEAPPSKFAAAGTKAHEAAEAILTNDDWVLFTSLDAESRSAVKVYVDYVGRTCAEAYDENIYVEQRLFNKGLRSADPTYRGAAPVFGTADCVIDEPNQLTIIDYKHGQGVVVEAVDNYQLALYGLLALDYYGEKDQLKLVIVQPRAAHPDGPIREWSISAAELDRVWFPRFQNAIKQCWEADKAYGTVKFADYLKPGDHCQWCVAAASECPAIRQQSLTKAQASFDDKAITVPDPATLDVEQLAKVLDAEPLLLTYLKACKTRAAQLLGQGDQVPGRKLVRSWGNRKWKDESIVKKRLRELGLMDTEMLSTKLKSPNQIKKCLSKAERAEIFKHVERVEKDPIMVLESDNREAVDSKAAIVKMFEKE